MATKFLDAVSVQAAQVKAALAHPTISEGVARQQIPNILETVNLAQLDMQRDFGPAIDQLGIQALERFVVDIRESVVQICVSLNSMPDDLQPIPAARQVLDDLAIHGQMEAHLRENNSPTTRPTDLGFLKANAASVRANFNAFCQKVVLLMTPLQ